jgi:hypothetical protein
MFNVLVTFAGFIRLVARYGGCFSRGDAHPQGHVVHPGHLQKLREVVVNHTSLQNAGKHTSQRRVSHPHVMLVTCVNYHTCALLHTSVFHTATKSLHDIKLYPVKMDH